MIGLVDLAGQELVQAALEGSRHTLSPLPHVEDAMRAVSVGSLAALVVETDALDGRLFDFLIAVRPHGLPTLVVARDRSVGAAVEALRAGASDYLASPFEYESLMRAVERLIDESAAAPRESPASEPFVTQDTDVKATLELLRAVAASDATILIEGESGTGKELLAQMAHRASPRHRRELISINCAALPSGLLESELFGHERGAFTGAFTRVIGKFELAHGTTILLDEISELEFALQAKLLRVIQEKQVQRLGARQPVRVDFRLVATTNRDLAAEVRAGRFREDLYYRLNVLPLHLTPLRERPDDIPLLIDHFIRRHALRGRPAPLLSDESLRVLRRHHWPGNVRELENILERLALTHGGRAVQPSDLGLPFSPSRTPAPPSLEAPPFRTLREMERWLIVRTLTQRQGNRTKTARDLQISLRTLRNKIHEYGIVEPETLPRTGIATRRAGRSRSATPDQAEAAG